MKIRRTECPGVMIIEPAVFSDSRGFFMETFQEKRYRDAGIVDRFVQDNLSASTKGTLRGLHYQYPHAQAKLVQVFQGEIMDVAVDIRRGSPTFGKAVSVVLNDENRWQLYIPAGYAHGFAVLSDSAVFSYKCSDFYAPENEGGIIWSDPALNIQWPVENPILSDRDSNHSRLGEIPPEKLPPYREE